MKKKTKKNCKIHLKVGDIVEVITGEYKTEEGEVIYIDKNKQRAIVKGINRVTKHIKRKSKDQEGEIITIEAPIHISNLMILPKGDELPSRIGRKKDEDGKLQRYAKSTGNFL